MLPRRLTGYLSKKYSPADGADSGAYKIMTNSRPPVMVNSDFAAKYSVPDKETFYGIDIRGMLDPFKVFGNWATYTGFDNAGQQDASLWRRIDFIFTGSNKTL
jgi:hypothetical protein